MKLYPTTAREREAVYEVVINLVRAPPRKSQKRIKERR